MTVSSKQNAPEASAIGVRGLLSKFLMVAWSALATFLIAQPLHAQNNIRVKGHITAVTGQPVTNATVLVKGSKTGISSDESGNFEILAPSNATLVISSVNFTTISIRVDGRTSINVILAPANNSLDQVVVVGYGAQKKRDITGSVVSVTGATLQEVPTANLISELQGRAAGVDIVSNSSGPGAAGQIRIRGTRSLSAEVTGNTPGANAAFTAANDDALNGPLIVLDGIPYGGSINDINPDDIASLDILKDASATAIYGSRGSGGVLIITTKRGRPGKAVMSYSGYFGVGNRTKEYPVFNGPQYAALKAEAQAGNSVNPNTTAYGLTTDEQAGLTKGTSTDWQKLIYKPSNTTDQNISLSGGNETTQFSLGGSYFKQTGIIPGQDFTRYALRMTIDYQISSKLKVGVNMINSMGYNNLGGNPVGGLVRLSPLLSPYNADGTINQLPQAQNIDNTVVNPLSIIYNAAAIVNNSRRLRTFNSLYGEWEIIPHLKYRVNVGLDYTQTQSGSYSGPNTFYNGSVSLNQANESVVNNEPYQVTLENLLTYDRTFREKHHITVTGLYSVQKDHSQTSAFTGTGIPADYIENYNLNLANSLAANTAFNPSGGNFLERGLVSYMGRVNYAFMSRYLLTATIRTDASSVLSPGNQYFTYPALAIGWNIANEDFMKAISAINTLKLRAGWGVTSNQGITPYATLGTLGTNFYNFGPGTAGQNIGYLVQTLANKTLKWQSTTEEDLGLDFGLLKNRITGTFDVYTEKTNNILLNEALPGSNGAGSSTVNAGKTSGHGFEISLNTINIQNPNGFSWSTDVNISVDRNQIVQLQNPNLKSDIGNQWFVGQPLTVIYDVKKLGIWQTADSQAAKGFGQLPGQIRVQDLDKDRKITANDRQVLGNYEPQWIGGLTNRFAYKGFDLSVVMFARMGQKVDVNYLTTDGGAQGFDFFNNSRNNQIKINYWTYTNPTNDFPRPDASADKFVYASTLGYQDGSFIKVRSINLGYVVPSKFLSGIGISSLRVYVTALNPFILYSPLVKSGMAIDPEGNGYGGTVTSTAGGTLPNRAITVGLGAPPVRQFNFGINVKF